MDVSTPGLIAILVLFLVACLGPMLLLLLPHVGRHELFAELLGPLLAEPDRQARVVTLPDGPMDLPVLTGRTGGRPMTLSPDPLVDEERPGALLLEILRGQEEPGSTGGRLELFPEDTGRAERFAGLTPLRALPSWLDGYEVLTDDPVWARGAIDRAAADLGPLLEAIDAIEVVVSVNPRRVLARKMRRPRDAEEMAQVVRGIEAFAGALLGPSPGGEDVAAEVCVACARPDPPLRCRTCQAPYHRECFTTASACALYPCTSRTLSG